MSRQRIEKLKAEEEQLIDLVSEFESDMQLVKNLSVYKVLDYRRNALITDLEEVRAKIAALKEGE